MLQVQYRRVIDLTLPLIPGAGARPFEIERARTEVLTGHEPVAHPWYVMHRVRTMSHIGTHIEAPYHCFEAGRDLGSLPLEQLIGEAVVIDLSQFPPDTIVDAEAMAVAASAADGVRQGDIALLFTGYAHRRSTPEFDRRPSLTAAAMTYLVEAGVKLVGTDLDGLEGPRTPGDLACHLVLLGNDIPFIENLTNLATLSRPRVFVCALPVPVRGLDAFPLRVVAFE